jgi:hypothetical protein
MHRIGIVPLILSLWVLSVVSCSTFNNHSTNAPHWAQHIIGKYAGEVRSSDELMPVETTFQIDERGLLSGTYRITGANSLVNGVLVQFKEEGPHSLMSKWQDPYGKGTLLLTFSGDYKRFDGVWTFEEPEGEHPWTGVKLDP